MRPWPAFDSTTSTARSHAYGAPNPETIRLLAGSARTVKLPGALGWWQAPGARRGVLAAAATVALVGGGVGVWRLSRTGPQAAPTAAPRVLPSGVEVRDLPEPAEPAELTAHPRARLRVLVVRGKTRGSHDRIRRLAALAAAVPTRFPELVRRHSEDAWSRAHDGDVGDVDLTQPGGVAGLSGETLTAIAAQRVGAVGGPYPGARGLYLVRVEARLPRPGPQPGPPGP